MSTIIFFGKPIEIDDSRTIPIHFTPPTQADKARELVARLADDVINDMAARLRQEREYLCGILDTGDE